MKTSKPTNEETQIPVNIPAEGSLGLLALGAVGIKAWRKKREELFKKATDKKNG